MIYWELNFILILKLLYLSIVQLSFALFLSLYISRSIKFCIPSPYFFHILGWSIDGGDVWSPLQKKKKKQPALNGKWKVCIYECWIIWFSYSVNAVVFPVYRLGGHSFATLNVAAVCSVAGSVVASTTPKTFQFTLLLEISCDVEKLRKKQLIKHISSNKIANLQKKLNSLCANSRWNKHSSPKIKLINSLRKSAWI